MLYFCSCCFFHNLYLFLVVLFLLLFLKLRIRLIIVATLWEVCLLVRSPLLIHTRINVRTRTPMLYYTDYEAFMQTSFLYVVAFLLRCCFCSRVRETERREIKQATRVFSLQAHLMKQQDEIG